MVVEITSAAAVAADAVLDSTFSHRGLARECRDFVQTSDQELRTLSCRRRRPRPCISLHRSRKAGGVRAAWEPVAKVVTPLLSVSLSLVSFHLYSVADGENIRS